MREITNYEYMHLKVKQARGVAKDYLCVDCQETQARDWSLKASVNPVNVRIHLKDGDNKGRVFSLDVDDYEPRCRSCHSAYDVKHGLARAPIGNRNGQARGRHARKEKVTGQPQLDGHEV